MNANSLKPKSAVPPTLPEDAPTLLVVDDNVDFRNLALHTLRRRFRVVEACGGEQAIEILKETRPSAILLDLSMPRVSGFDVLDHMRLFPRLLSIPVVIITAFNVESIRERLEKKPNVLLLLGKTEAFNNLAEECLRAVEMGKLYNSTPVIRESLRRAGAPKHPRRGQAAL